jgi:hypothetical protein
VWVGLDGDEIVSAHLAAGQRKLRNIARDPRVGLSIEGTEVQPPGLLQYLVVHGRAGSPTAERPSCSRRSRAGTLGPA